MYRNQRCVLPYLIWKVIEVCSDANAMKRLSEATINYLATQITHLPHLITSQFLKMWFIL